MSTYRDGLGRNVPRRLPRGRHLRGIFAGGTSDTRPCAEKTCPEYVSGGAVFCDLHIEEPESDFGGAFDGFTVTSDAGSGALMAAHGRPTPPFAEEIAGMTYHFAPLTEDELADVVDALELFAGIDEGEHTDLDRLRHLAGALRAVPGYRDDAGRGIALPEEARAS